MIVVFPEMYALLPNNEITYNRMFNILIAKAESLGKISRRNVFN